MSDSKSRTELIAREILGMTHGELMELGYQLSDIAIDREDDDEDIRVRQNFGPFLHSWADGYVHEIDFTPKDTHHE